MPWYHACPANRDGNCAFEDYNDPCNECSWENCFESNLKWNPRIREYKTPNGKTVRIVTHVTNEKWIWGEKNYQNGFDIEYLKKVYGKHV